MDANLRQPHEGHLIKFTNVVKGWQSRWFILDPERGMLEYFLNEGDKYEKARGSLHLAGAVISPSDEDSLTFTVSPAGGESYKLRAHDTRDRQMWINRLRLIAEMHTRAIAHHNPPLAPREHWVREQSVGTSPHFHWMGASAGGGLDVIDAFTQVAEFLEESQRQHAALSQAIEELPSHGPSMRCIDSSVLLIKATSQATLMCLDHCLSDLRSRHSALQYSSGHSSSTQQLTPLHQQKTQSGSPIRSVSSLRNRSSPHTPPKAPSSCDSDTTFASFDSRSSDVAESSNQTAPTGAQQTLPSQSAKSSDSKSESDGEVTDPEEEITPSPVHVPEETEDSQADEGDGGSRALKVQSTADGGGEQRSVLMHIISQLRLGMDLTRVTLPTFILEKRSLLEMFADFLGHPDLFLKIAFCDSPESRICAVARWYLTSIHVGRRGSTAKKPYNPIIGEVFRCSWRVSAHLVHHVSQPSSEKVSSGSDSTEEGEGVSLHPPFYTIHFSSEQVSHHPPVSAFYMECPELEMCVNAHIWTKSKFMGMSVGVNLVGNICLVLGEADVRETYQLAMPSAYARNVLMEPWVELGGRVNVVCPQTGYSAPIIFHTKPFYGGRLHRVTCEVKSPAGRVVLRVSGEWDAALTFEFEDGRTETLDVSSLPLCSRKRVRHLRSQASNESRRLWLDVSRALARDQLHTATNHKRALEDCQRADEQQRREANVSFVTRVFSPGSNDAWVFKEMPKFAQSLFYQHQNATVQ